jgi:lipopolysaccharide/colanic/teichoic acid biosynthesis glycosyltransferase
MPRILEFLLILLVMLVFAIPIFLTGIAILLVLGNPVFFRQQRVGKSKVPFNILKFRTMTNQTDKDGNLLPDEMRQTFFTRLVRRTRIDELPQLIAILKGDMALIGPRPLLPETIEEFGILGEERCRVRPGLTGLSQVSGNVHLNNSEKFKLDLWYVHHRSLLLDLKILSETVLVIIFGEKIRKDRISKADIWLTSKGLDQYFKV